MRSWIKRWLRMGPPSQAPLIATLEPVSERAQAFRNSKLTLSIRLQNQGNEIWNRSGAHRVVLEYRWLAFRDHNIIATGDRLGLPRAFHPAEQATLTFQFTAPPWLGDHVLELELLRLHSFNNHNEGTTIRIPCHVDESSRYDCDYVKWYRSINLSRDHWTIVGPTSREEYLKLQQAQFRMLLEMGMTPTSRILDVGCGTGKLAEPLLEFLSDEGLYVGTDVGREGIEYCQQRYQRENFRFLTNEMTSIPIQNQTFDFIVLFSVFTHTYAEETELLLRETKRLLNPGGLILADVFESPLVMKEAGRRGAVELGQGVIDGIAQQVGLQPVTAESWCHSMGPFTQRRFIIFR